MQSNRDTDLENGHVDMREEGEEGEGGKNQGRSTDVYTLPFVK